MTLIKPSPLARVRRQELAARLGRLSGLGVPDRDVVANNGLCREALNALRAEAEFTEAFNGGTEFVKRVTKDWKHKQGGST